MKPIIHPFFDGATNTVTYLVADPATRRAAIIDPVLDFDPKSGRLSTASSDAVMARARAEGLEVVWILETHAHADHLSAADRLRHETGAQVVIGRHIEAVQKAFGDLFEVEAPTRVFDRLVDDGDTLPLGDMTIQVLHTPGHTPACVTYLMEDAAFVGDTLFMPDYGTARADFPGGDAATLYRSIQKILALPPETRIFVCHDYLPAGRNTIAWETSVADERARNVHVHDGVSETDFVAMRTARDATLAAPVLILPSLQVNIQAGALPAASAKGRIFLKLPVNAL
jgi:glyoxylase-like metal-dependent hydrolase (beta-lactamase superfamily II)